MTASTSVTTPTRADRPANSGPKFEQFTINIGGSVANLIHGDAFDGMSKIADQSIDLAIVDPPYGASTTKQWRLAQSHGLPGFGGGWQIAGHEWDKLTGLDSLEFTISYLRHLNRVVKSTGSLFIHSTYHNSGIVNVACQMLGIEIINEIVWYKRNAFPNLANRRLTASHETIHWAHTGSESRRLYRFNAAAVKAASFSNDGLKLAGKQMRTVWDIPNNKSRSELAHGKHPTQKPLSVTERILLIAGAKNETLLVPFVGSGTELVAGLRAEMNVLGFETDKEYFDLAARRVQAIAASQQPPLEGL